MFAHQGHLGLSEEWDLRGDSPWMSSLGTNMRSNLSYTKYSPDSSHSDTFAIVMQLQPIISLHQLQVRRYYM